MTTLTAPVLVTPTVNAAVPTLVPVEVTLTNRTFQVSESLVAQLEPMPAVINNKTYKEIMECQYDILNDLAWIILANYNGKHHKTRRYASRIRNLIFTIEQVYPQVTDPDHLRDLEIANDRLQILFDQVTVLFDLTANPCDRKCPINGCIPVLKKECGVCTKTMCALCKLYKHLFHKLGRVLLAFLLGDRKKALCYVMLLQKLRYDLHIRYCLVSCCDQKMDLKIMKENVERLMGQVMLMFGICLQDIVDFDAEYHK